MNNVIDEVLDTAQTDNKIKYTLTHADGTTELVQLDLATPVTVAGTPLNKLLFDSIADDLNTRLLISNKATDNEAIAGTDTTKYIVPSTLQAKLNKMSAWNGTTETKTGNAGETNLYNIFTPSQVGSPSTGTVTINGVFYTPASNYNQDIQIVGTTLYGGTLYTSNSSNTIANNLDRIVNVDNYSFVAVTGDSVARRRMPFKIEINFNTRTIKMTTFRWGNREFRELLCSYNTLTAIQVRLRSPNSSDRSQCIYSISYTR